MNKLGNINTALIIILIIGVFIFAVPLPYTEIEVYTIQEPYTGTETYTTKEPYTGTETYTTKEPYQTKVCEEVPPRIGDIITGQTVVDVITGVVTDTNPFIECNMETRYRDVTKYRTVTEYRTVRKEREVTKYRTVRKEREVTEYATLFMRLTKQ